MVKHAAKDQKPLLTTAQRVDRAFTKLTAGRLFTPESRNSGWQGRDNMSGQVDRFLWKR